METDLKVELQAELSEIALDADGHLHDYLQWSEDVAQQLAAVHGLSALNAQQLSILHTVRLFYQRFQHAPATRPLVKFVMQQMGAEFDNARLMAEFNTGLVARTLAKLAGLPKPANCL